MKRSVLLEVYEEFETVTFYTIRFSDEEISETDKFFDNFNSEEFFEGMRILSREIEKIIEVGAIERYFRPEGKLRSSLWALPLNVEGGSLRLFCLRMHDGILILGNGYQKTDVSYNNDPIAKSHADLLETIEKMLRARLRDGRTVEYQNKYYEHLKFEITL